MHRDGNDRHRHTCWSSAGVEKRAVVPLMMEEKEKEPVPYLQETTADGGGEPTGGEPSKWVPSSPQLCSINTSPCRGQAPGLEPTTFVLLGALEPRKTSLQGR